MKYRLIFLFALVGGILGFISHLIWHFKLGIQLFIFSPHILTGIFHTVIGIIIGGIIGYIMHRK